MPDLDQRKIDLETAVSQILQSCCTKQPFFFIIGSGVSFPSVISANEIIRICKSISIDQGRQGDCCPNDLLDQYTYWFLQAFPNAKDRQEFIKNLVTDKPVTDATFRLAHILLSARVSNIVVTTNFDELIEKALSIFGAPHISHEHATIADQIDFDDTAIQIVHVHGTHRYYNLCNLKDEILSRAHYPDNTCVSMSNRLDQLLMNKSPIVIGYGGWQGDIITGALKRRLYGPYGQQVTLPYNIYWFCFNHESLDILPAFLKDHSNVLFVLPKTNPNIDAIEIKSNCILPASTVFEQFIRSGEIEKPALTTQPLEFLANRLESSIYIPEIGDVDYEDPYDILSIAHRIRKTTLKKLTADEQTMENLRDLIRVSNYKKAIQILLEVDFDRFPNDLLPELLQKSNTVISNIINMGWVYQDEYELVNALINKITALSNICDVRKLIGLESYSQIIFTRMIALHRCNLLKESLECSKRFIEEFDGEENPKTRFLVFKAKLNMNAMLISCGDKRNSVEEIARMCLTNKDTVDIEMKKTITGHLLIAATSANEFDKELSCALYDETIRIADSGKDNHMKFAKMRALVNKAICLEVLGRPVNTIELFRQAIEVAKSDTSGFFDVPLAGAYFNLGYKHLKSSNFEEAIKTYMWLIEKFAQSSVDYIQNLLCDSWNSIGLAQIKLGRIDEARLSFQKTIDFIEKHPKIQIESRIYANIGLGDRQQAMNLIVKMRDVSRWRLELFIESLGQFMSEVDTGWAIAMLSDKMKATD